MFNPLKPELRLNDIYTAISYLTENTLRLRFKDQRINAAWGKTIAVYSANHKKATN
jgi:hypothetical protein